MSDFCPEGSGVNCYACFENSHPPKEDSVTIKTPQQRRDWTLWTNCAKLSPWKRGLVSFFETFHRKPIGTQSYRESLTSTRNRVLRSR
jgi:hypothetical protein